MLRKIVKEELIINQLAHSLRKSSQAKLWVKVLQKSLPNVGRAEHARARQAFPRLLGVVAVSPWVMQICKWITHPKCACRSSF